MTFPYQRTKFLSLTVKQQHKRCAALLKQLYEDKDSHAASVMSKEHYSELCSWMGIPVSPLSSFEDFANAYHLHLEGAELSLKEHRLLSKQSKGDHLSAQPMWNIDIYLDNLRSAHNVGSIVRTTEAFALGTLHFGGTTPNLDNAKVQKTAMGSQEWIQAPYCNTSNIDQLKRPIIALETSREATSIYDYIFPDSFTLVLGNEEYGCSEKMLDAADVILAIPLRGHKNSLNVANAFSCIAFEIARQRSARMHP